MNRRGPDDSLSPEKMQLFLAGLAGMPQDEVRDAKVLYVKNAISEYRAFLTQYRAQGCLLVLFAVIPIFWPFLIVGWITANSQKKLMKERIQNAIEVWRDDLEGENLDLPF